MQNKELFVTEAQRFLTERIGPATPNSKLEDGTPIFNQTGQLTNVVLSNGTLLPVTDLAATLGALPNISASSATTPALPHINPVYDNWKKGIFNYYQGDYATARVEFQEAARRNALFTAPVAFEQLVATRTNEGSQSQPPIRIKFWAFDINIPDIRIFIFIITVLAIVFILVALLIIYAHVRRLRLVKGYAEAGRFAQKGIASQPMTPTYSPKGKRAMRVFSSNTAYTGVGTRLISPSVPLRSIMLLHIAVHIVKCASLPIERAAEAPA